MSPVGVVPLNVGDTPTQCGKGVVLLEKVTHLGSSMCVANNSVLAYCADTFIALHDVTTHERLRLIATGFARYATTLCMLSDSQMSGGFPDGTISVWNVKGGGWIRTSDAHTKMISSMCCLFPEHLASASRDGTVKVWRWDTGQLRHCLRAPAETDGDAFAPTNPQQASDEPSMLCVCAVSRTFVSSGTSSGTVQMWNWSTGRHERSFEGHSSAVNCVCAVAEDVFASASLDCTVRLWDWRTGACFCVMPQPHYVTSVCMASAFVLAVACVGGPIGMWNVQTGERIDVLEGHRVDVRCVCLVREGQLASSSSTDETIRLWDVSGTVSTACVDQPWPSRRRSNLPDNPGAHFCDPVVRPGTIQRTTFARASFRRVRVLFKHSASRCVQVFPTRALVFVESML